MRKKHWSLAKKTFALASLALMLAAPTAFAAETRPNILLILADDMGFNDLGVTGGEIATPTLDSLANEGVLMTDFHVAPTCSLTRSMLMTGTDTHRNGLGTMAERQKFLAPNQKGQPGYIGHLNDNVVTVAQELKDSGYHTYMVGKWHLGLTPEKQPNGQGFEQFFGILEGGGSHLDTRGLNTKAPVTEYYENTKLIEKLPDDFYSTNAYTDKMIKFIDSSGNDGKPWFAYTAYTSPHWPLMAPKKDIEKYKGRYDSGYEALRLERIARMQKLGLIGDDITPAPFWDKLPKWDSLTAEQKKIESRKMEIYAAMVDNMDQNISRLINHLKKTGEYDNTVIIFFSDNGAAGDNPFNIMKRFKGAEEFLATFDLSYENMGLKNSYVFYGTQWALAGTAPRRHFKGFPSEGGIVSPLIIKMPKKQYAKGRDNTFAHIMDINATIMDLAGIKPVDSYKGKKILQPIGKSLMPLIDGKADRVHGDDEIFGWELTNNRGVRKGDWKIIDIADKRFPTGTWQLFNLVDDPGETNDLAQKNPKKLQEMIAAWDSYVKANGLIEPIWPDKKQ